ncbi:MAG: hypothetical protein A2270_01290 [Elusimicrobia bacterium RIFOXYA12_FULL_51_18]|nr:MAG: hypothetical protein A2270_01290 [Elusimicrobia bacterium RIFOXYA12_FULL_51_18]OGS30034.1 MAG: hypothetical protein A2218_12855 [Elusimicrobia bacterium RIFOXYA2_FULL_53_38]
MKANTPIAKIKVVISGNFLCIPFASFHHNNSIEGKTPYVNGLSFSKRENFYEKAHIDIG